MITGLATAFVFSILMSIAAVSPIKKTESKEDKEGRETFLIVSSIISIVLFIALMSAFSDLIEGKNEVKPPLNDRQLEYNCVLTSIEKYNKSFDQASSDCKKLVKLYNEVK